LEVMGEPLFSTKPNEQMATGDAPTQPRGANDVTLPLPAATKPGAPPHSNAPPGTHLGPYELIEVLGRGGMGTVWKARHTKLDKLVALKLLPPHLMTDAEAVSRFEREMKAVGKLEHPHIVRAMDAGEADGMHYLVMEYIEGTDLSRIVKTRGPRSIAEACQMVRHAALGLAHAHEHDLVHRDIKPSNLLLSKKGLVKILDLGLARLQGERAADEASLTMQGETMGTPDYMAPEQWQSAHTAGPEVDLYALGCTLYHLLVGHPPFSDPQHSSFGQKMKAHLLEQPPKLRAARPEVPEEVESLYQSLLAKDPMQRPKSAKFLADELRLLLKSWTKSPSPAETIDLGSPTPVKVEADAKVVSTQRSRRRSIIAGLAAAILLSLTAVAGLWRYGRSDQAEQNLPPVTAREPSTGDTGSTRTASTSETTSVDETAKDLYALGRDLCFVHDDWKKGIPLLAKGHQPAIRQAALLELAGAAAPEAQAEIGTLWHTAAASTSEPDNWHCYRRARFWLMKALASGSSESDSTWYQAAQKQMDILPTLKTILRIKAHSFNSEIITIGRNHIEWVSRDGADPQQIVNLKTGVEIPSFHSKYGIRDVHTFSAEQIRRVLPEAVDFTTAKLRVISKSGPTSSVVSAAISPDRSDESKVTIRLAEWDSKKNAFGNYQGDFQIEVALSFGR
jgi:serine/threonine protein kinase